MFYVCSDIHGHFARYKQAINCITDNDVLYIIGDVIDRGPDGIAILKDLMSRQNVHLIIGNHEDMMLRSLYFNNEQQYLNWVQLANGGGITKYCFNEETEQTQQQILDYLYNCPLSVKLTVNDQTFVLCHSGTKIGYENVNYKDASDRLKWIILWHSPFRKDLPISLDSYSQDYHYIIGHVSVQKLGTNQIYTLSSKHITDIDCGCAYIQYCDTTSLALLNLNTWQCEYLI